MRIGKEDLPKGENQNQRNRANITDCHSRKKFPEKKKNKQYITFLRILAQNNWARNAVTIILRHSLVKLLDFKKAVCAQQCPTICNPIYCGPPGSSVHRISQGRILEWVAIAFSLKKGRSGGNYLARKRTHDLYRKEN